MIYQTKIKWQKNLLGDDAGEERPAWPRVATPTLWRGESNFLVSTGKRRPSGLF
jgi:hypothetical protein